MKTKLQTRNAKVQFLQDFMRGKAGLNDLRVPVAGFIVTEGGRVYSYSDNTGRHEQFSEGIELSEFKPPCDMLLKYRVVRHRPEVYNQDYLKDEKEGYQ